MTETHRKGKRAAKKVERRNKRRLSQEEIEAILRESAKGAQELHEELRRMSWVDENFRVR